MRQSHLQHVFLSFSVGPLHSDLEYTVSSQKEGYVLTAVEGTIGDFKAYALAGVSFEVTPYAFCLFLSFEGRTGSIWTFLG